LVEHNPRKHTGQEKVPSPPKTPSSAGSNDLSTQDSTSPCVADVKRTAPRAVHDEGDGGGHKLCNGEMYLWQYASMAVTASTTVAGYLTMRIWTRWELVYGH